MPGMFRVTYEIITPESAERGDFAEHGFMLPGGYRASAETSRDVSMTLREALRLCSPQEDSGGGWFSEVDGRTDYRTGAEERRSLHPPRGISAASYDRLARLILR